MNIGIIGGGITGLMCAYTFLSAGHRTSLYDPSGFPARLSASYIAGGMLAPYSEIDLMTPAFIEAGLESIQIWSQLASVLGFSEHFHATGSLLIAHRADQHMLERFATHLPHGAGTTVQARDIEPALPVSFTKAISLPNEAFIHPHRAIEALCTHLNAHEGFSFHEQAADPAQLESCYDFVLDCRGMGAAQAEPDLRGVKGEIATVHNPEFSLARAVRVMHPRYPLYIIPRGDGLFTVGATQIESGNNVDVSVRSAMELLSALYGLNPSFGEARIIDLQAGIRPAYPDNLPHIRRRGRVISINGLFRHGYLLSPILAQEAVSMIESKPIQSLFGQEAA
jgi:glycine oxidase